jgi:hypothetical protein
VGIDSTTGPKEGMADPFAREDTTIKVITGIPNSIHMTPKMGAATGLFRD